MKSDEKYARRRLKTSYAAMVVSLTLVLLMLGSLGLILLYAKKISDYVKENIGINITIRENVREADILRLKKTIDASFYVKSSTYVSKEQAAKELKEDLGEDFIGFLGFNPLLPSIDVHVKAVYANSDSLTIIKNKLSGNPIIKEVFFQKSVIDIINQNVRKIGLVLTGFSTLLLVVAIALINNTIRLSVYSKRFILRSMLLVGATHGFISRPFIIRGILSGFIGSILALILLTLLIIVTSNQIPELIDLQDTNMFAILFGIVLFLGVIISWLSNYFAVRKYLYIKPDNLYS